MQNSWAKQEESQTRSTRQTAGREAVSREQVASARDFQSSQAGIIRAFEQSKPKLEERRALLKKEAKSFWDGGGGLNFENADGTPANPPQGSASPKPSKSTTSTDSGRPPPPRHPSETKSDMKSSGPAALRSPTSQSAADVDAEHDAAFEKDMLLAKQASLSEHGGKDGDPHLEKQVRLAEQRGYERALADLQAKMAEQKRANGE